MTNDIPPHGRPIAAGMAIAGVLGLLVNHLAGDSLSVGRLMILALGPLMLLVGIGGMIEPKILWSLGKYRGNLPLVYTLIGGALAAAGVAITLLLVFWVYPLGRP